MAGESQQGGISLIVEELLDRGGPAFVDELRRFHDAGATSGDYTDARWRPFFGG